MGKRFGACAARVARAWVSSRHGGRAAWATSRSKPARARSPPPALRRKRASWCSARTGRASRTAAAPDRCRRADGPRRSRRGSPGSSACCQVCTIVTSASRTGPGPVVELDRAADVDAAGVDLGRDAAHPALEQRAQPRQPARLAQRRRKTSSSNLAWYSRTTEICSSSREPKWANTPDLLISVTSASAPIDSPSRPMCDASSERRVEDGGARLPALHQRLGRRRRQAAGGCRWRVRVSSATAGLESERSCYFAEKAPTRRLRRAFCKNS